MENFNYSRDICRKGIAGGQDSSKGAYPWHVLLRRNRLVACGGSLLNKRLVLTGKLPSKGSFAAKSGAK